VSRKYKIRDQDKLYFATFTVVEWIDLFTRREYRDIFLDSLRYCHEFKGLDLCVYCMRSSRLHMVLGRNGDQSLVGLMRDIKKFTAVKILEVLKASPTESRKEFLLWHFGKAGRANPNNTHFQVWQLHSQPIEVNTNEKISLCLDYIHQNPVKAGIVLSQADYLYSSAANYAGMPETLIDVLLIE
jgi:putative transposase